MHEPLARLVRSRASGIGVSTRCLPQRYSSATFEIDHIIPQQHGRTDLAGEPGTGLFRRQSLIKVQTWQASTPRLASERGSSTLAVKNGNGTSAGQDLSWWAEHRTVGPRLQCFRSTRGIVCAAAALIAERVFPIEPAAASLFAGAVAQLPLSMQARFATSRPFYLFPQATGPRSHTRLTGRCFMCIAFNHVLAAGGGSLGSS